MKTSLWRCSSIRRITFTFCSLLIMANAALAQEAELVRVVDEDGRETSLYQKLITVKQNSIVWPTPKKGSNAKAKYVSAYNIFYHAKTQAGQNEQGGYYRIADRAGNPLGWVAKEDVTIWATRFVIKPKRLPDGNTFTLTNIKGDDEKATAEFNPRTIPDDASAYSFVLNKSLGKGEGAEDNGPFPLAFVVARTDNAGSAAELNEIGDMKLEIVFVLEMTDFFLTEYGGKTLVQYIQDLGAEYVRLIKANAGSDGELPTRLGLVVYQDTNTKAVIKRPRVIQPLSDDIDRWLGHMNALSPDQIGADLPEDGLSGLSTAVMDSKVGWGENSSKHIILIGHGAFQERGRKNRWNPVPHALDFFNDRGNAIYWPAAEGGIQEPLLWDDHFGYNSLGRNLSDIHNAAFPQGGSTEGTRLRKTKHIHTIRAGQTFNQRMENDEDLEDPAAVLAMFDNVNKAIAGLPKDEVLDGYFKLSKSNDEDDQLLAFAIKWSYKALVCQTVDKLALQQYEAAATSGGENGYFAELDPDEASVKRVTNDIKSRIDAAIQVIGKVASGEAQSVADADEQGDAFTKPIFDLIGSTLKRGEVVKQPVRVGVASLRSEETGRLVGTKLIMVSREELNRLGGIFSQLYEQFEKKKARAQRQDVTSILDDLKKSLTSAATGQEIDENTELRTLITDLPLRTEALKLTAGDIAVMPSKDFQVWLDDLNTAKRRTQSLLTSDSGQWIKISALAKKEDQYNFLKLSELP